MVTKIYRSYENRVVTIEDLIGFLAWMGVFITWVHIFLKPFYFMYVLHAFWGTWECIA